MLRLVLTTAALLCVAANAQGFRQIIPLNGAWEYCLVEDLAPPSPATEWQPIEVPGAVAGGRGESAWFRTTFQGPALPPGARAHLRFGGVKYNSTIRLNGVAVGGEYSGYDPFSLDVTAALRPNGGNTLLVGCRDWSGVFSRPVDLEGRASDWLALRDVPNDAILAPIGGLMTLFGPWDDVELHILPATRIEHVAITTSVRQGTLTVECQLADDARLEADLTIASRVLDGGREALRLPTGRAPDGLNVATAWPDARLWSHEDPYLYELETTLLADGEAIDRTLTRFGFRELWADGPDVVLNGSRIHMLATSSWPLHEEFRTREEVRGFWEAIKAGGNNAFRTHTQPWRRIFYDVADEVGVLVIPEGAIWNDDTSYRVDDPEFWAHYSTHLNRMARQYRNHPSVVMYSLENEFYGARMNERNEYATRMLAEMGRRLKAWDPTRPITYESDGDPLGVADVIGLHYPHEYPDFNEYPNTGWWIDRDEPTSWEMFGRDDAGNWRWDRTKPLYIGEFLWVPSNTPAWDSILLGDEAYTDYARTHLLAKALAWRMQIEGYRDSGVSGICPWTEVEGGPLDDSNPLYVSQRQAYRPIIAFPREYNANFYGGQTVARTLVVCNDILDRSDLELTWSLQAGGNVVDRGSVRIALDAGGRARVPIELNIPAVDERTELAWSIVIERDGERRFDERHTYWAHPREGLRLPAAVGVMVYDPTGALEGILPPEATRVQSVDELSPADISIIGPDAFPEEPEPIPTIGHAEGDGLIEPLVEGGGRVIVLEQRSVPPTLLGGGLTSHQSTMAFAHMPDHPALTGVTGRDLKWWADPDPGIPDHLVSRNEWPRPEKGAGRAIVTAGGAPGLAYAPLLEVPRGRGVLLLSQLRLVEKLSVEPIASRVLQNLLDYAASYPDGSRRAVSLIAEDPRYRKLLESAEVPLGGGADTDPAGQILLCAGPVAAPDAVREALEAGATVLLHRPDQATWEAVAGPLSEGWIVRTASGPVTRVSGSWLAQHLAREDLYWLGPSTGPAYTAVPLSPYIVDSSLVPRFSLERRRIIQAEDAEWQGLLASPLEGGAAIGLFTAGSVEADVDFGNGGPFLLGGRLGGTPSEGVYPVCRVSIDGEPVGVISLGAGAYEDYAVAADVPPGRHTLTLGFINDGSTTTEDRNLFVDSLLVAPYQRVADDLEVIIEPGALAEARVGAGRLIVDFIRWDEPGSNALRASRYLCSLLTALGAELGDSPSSAIELEGLTPDESVIYGGAQAGELFLGMTGSARGQVLVAEPGGTFRFEVLGRGTAVDGVYPIVEFTLNGELLGRTEIASDALAPHEVGVAGLEPGAYELEVRFTNDEYSPPHDRNVWMDRLTAYPIDDE